MLVGEQAAGGAELEGGLELEPFSLWAEDRGELPCEPVLHIEFGDEVRPSSGQKQSMHLPRHLFTASRFRV